MKIYFILGLITVLLYDAFGYFQKCIDEVKESKDDEKLISILSMMSSHLGMIVLWPGYLYFMLSGIIKGIKD